MRATIEAVEEFVDSGTPFWKVRGSISSDDDTSQTHYWIFPKDTLEWRAAEYGIPLSDRATLLDIVLAEPFIPVEEFAAGTSLYDAPSISDARTQHIARCSRAKLKMRLSTRGPGNDPLRRVQDDSPLDEEVAALKADLVRAGRAQRKAADDARRAPIADERRADAFRASIGHARLQEEVI